MCPECDIKIVVANLKIGASLEKANRLASAAVKRAIQEFDDVINDVPSKIPQPHSSERILLAGNKVRLAQEKYLRANSRLVDFISRGVIPDDLRPDD